MARTSAKAKKPPRQQIENNSTKTIESNEDNKSVTVVSQESIEIHNKENDLNYEVEKIVDSQVCEGKTQYLVRWKGYKKDSDTWESESVLQSCSESIEAYKKGNRRSSSKKPLKRNKSKIKRNQQSQRHLSERKSNANKRKLNTGKRAKSSSRKKIKLAGKQPKAKKMDDNSESDEESTDGISYEVEKIVEMRIKKNGSREFLIRWKGYNPGRDTWEPEGHLNCQDMIKRFIEDVNKIKLDKDAEIEETKNAKSTVPASGNDDH